MERAPCITGNTLSLFTCSQNYLCTGIQASILWRRASTPLVQMEILGHSVRITERLIGPLSQENKHKSFLMVQLQRNPFIFSKWKEKCTNENYVHKENSKRQPSSQIPTQCKRRGKGSKVKMQSLIWFSIYQRKNMLIIDRAERKFLNQSFFPVQIHFLQVIY